MNDSVFKMNLSPENIKYFVYKKERYPFDYDFFKRTSLYISKNDQYFRTQTNINLIENQNINLFPESITNFIKCCENQDFHVNESNVFHLHFLSVHYEVLYLQNVTKQYITDHLDHFALESLLANESLDIINTTFIENIISENLLSYIQKEDFLLLPIPVMHRLIKRYIDKSNQNSNLNDESLIIFLFKCLDKYGKKASVLFSLINIGQQRNDVIHKLLSEYYDIFDFTFINSTLLETTQELSNKLNRLEIKYSQELSSMKQLHDELKQMKELFETKFIPLATSISFTPQVDSIKADEEITITATIEPKNAIQILKWSVSDNRMQIKNVSGTSVGDYSGTQIILRGMHGGESTLIATTTDGSNLQFSTTLSVFQPVRSISIQPNAYNIKNEEEVKVTANVEPKDASNKIVTWKISGSGIQIKDSNGETGNEIKGQEVILRGINPGVSTLTVSAEDGSNVQFQTNIIITSKNILSYANGARITYVSATPYNCNSNMYFSINGGNTGKNSPVKSSLIYSEDNFWGPRNSWSVQGSLENNDNKNNIELTHNGDQKPTSSSTTISVSNGSVTTSVIINPRAYYGDISKCIFKMSECYLASANSDGDVGKYRMYVSTKSEETVSTNPNDSSWKLVADGSLITDSALTKVYDGNVDFRYIKLELNSRGKSYMELAAIKVY